MSNEIPSIECEEAIRKLLEYIDNELQQHDHQVMEKHLHTCRSCYSRMEFEQKLKFKIKENKLEKASDSLRSRIGKISDIF